MKTNFLGGLFRYFDKPKMSSWEREQMLKKQQEEGIDTGKYASYDEWMQPSPKELYEKKKKANRIKTLFLLVLVMLTILYEEMTGKTTLERLQELDLSSTAETTITETEQVGP